MITQGDVTAAARALLAQPDPDRRPELLQALMTEATRARAHRKRTGRIDPALGNGTLMAAALSRPHVAALDLSDPAHLRVLEMVIAGLIAWRAQRCSARSEPLHDPRAHHRKGKDDRRNRDNAGA